MKKLKCVIDTCSLKYSIKKYYYGFKGTYILPFQISELNKEEISSYFKAGGRLLPITTKYKGDSNFYALDPEKYCITTHDKKLKRKLKVLKYTVHNNIYFKPEVYS